LRGEKRFLAFLRGQLAQIRRGGIAVLWRKATYVLAPLPFLPLVLLIRVLHPWISIRFGLLISYRIGHFSTNTELYLTQRELTETKRPVLDLFFLDGAVSNQQLKKMWSRTLRISRFARHAYVCNKLLPGKENHIVTLSAAWDVEGILENTRPHISFTTEEEQQGQRELKQLGLPDDTPFVGIHARDSGYLEYAFPSEEPGRWRYNDHRDSSIHSFVPAAEQLAMKGYYVFRTGVAVKEALNSANPRIFDYALNGRTDFLDIYIGAKCHFFICDTTGMSNIPMIFRRPTAWVNFVPMELAPTWNSKDLFLPKKLWLVDGHRFLTFQEILSSDICRFYTDEKYARLGIEVIDNTREEISSLVLEMEQRLSGTWQTNEEDEELQPRFWALFSPRYPKRVFRSRIGAEFLRQNQELLG